MVRRNRQAFPGRVDQVSRARRFVRQPLDGCPVVDDAALCVSELVTNALVHTASGGGGKFEVVVDCDNARTRIAVHDGGSGKTPAALTVGGESEEGRGLSLVSSLAHAWGQSGDEQGRTVWFELRWASGETDHPAQRVWHSLGCSTSRVDKLSGGRHVRPGVFSAEVCADRECDPAMDSSW
jgi:anti-sigma regulatory factor (Ser/Thr protein kinase)